jgi:hypothetical protein
MSMETFICPKCKRQGCWTEENEFDYVCKCGHSVQVEPELTDLSQADLIAKLYKAESDNARLCMRILDLEIAAQKYIDGELTSGAFEDVIQHKSSEPSPPPVLEAAEKAAKSLIQDDRTLDDVAQLAPIIASAFRDFVPVSELEKLEPYLEHKSDCAYLREGDVTEWKFNNGYPECTCGFDAILRRKP